MVARIRAAGLEPPSVEELAPEFGDETRQLLALSTREGSLVQVEESRYYGASSFEEIIGRIRRALASGAELTPSQLKDALGVSRKYLIPLLEYCDRTGRTARRGNGRVWTGG